MTGGAEGSGKAESVTRVAVEVTFLKLDEEPPWARDTPPFPGGASLVRLARPSLAFYRYLYGTVGRPYCWWLRRVMPDPELATLLGSPRVFVHVLYESGEPAGFFELETRAGHVVNLSYFGLFGHAIGRGLGMALLRAAVREAWTLGAKTVTVNTCDADHPRALPNYLACGFRVTRRVQEIWPIPNRLGLTIPAHLPRVPV